MSPRRAYSSSYQLCSCEQLKGNYLQDLFELFWLYFIAAYELVRQVFHRRLYPSRFLAWKNSELSTRDNDEAGGGLECITIITGATSGIGREIHRELTRRGKRLIILSYPAEGGLYPGHQEILVDFSCRASTEDAARQVRAILSGTSSRKSVLLFHCAAIYNPIAHQDESQSAKIFETYTVNTVMPVLFVQALDDLITGIVYMGSSSQKVAPRPRLHSCPFCIAKSPHAAYPLSKMLTFAFFERWSQIKKRRVIIIHPGVVVTQLYKNVRGFVGIIMRSFLKFCALQADESARRVLQILDQALFFEEMRKTIPIETGSDLGAIFWDATTMRPAMTPQQISDKELREWIYNHLDDVAVSWGRA